MTSENEIQRYSLKSMLVLTRVTTDFVERCVAEQLLEVHLDDEHVKRYSAAEVRKLARIRRLHDDLGLDWPAIEIVLHMRSQMIEMLDEMEHMRQLARQRENELLRDLLRLQRQISKEMDWR